MKEQKGKTRKINAVMIVLGILMFIYALSMLIPLFWGLMTSIKHFSDFKTNTVGFPRFEYWADSKIEGETEWYSNYVYIWNSFKFPVKKTFFAGIFNVQKVSNESEVTFVSALVNTILCLGGSCLVATIFPCVMAYMCYNYRYKFSKIIYAVVIFTITLPLFGTTPSMINLLCQLNLFDTFLGMWIINASFGGTYFLVFYAAFSSVSSAYYEAAEIDGAGQFKIFISMGLPLVSKMISTVFVLLFVAQWNDYGTPMLYLPTKPTLAYAIFYVTHRPKYVAGQVPKMLAALILLVLPILILFVVFKEKLMGDVSLGGIKE